MPRFLLLIDQQPQEPQGHESEAGRVSEWMARGRAAGVVQARADLGETRLRVVREGGVTVVVSTGRSTAAARVLVFEAEDEASALAYAAGCPGEASLSLFGLEDGGLAGAIEP